MRSCIVLSTISILSTVVSALTTDPTSPSDNDWLLQDGSLSLGQLELSFNQPASLFDSAKSPDDSGFGFPDASGSLFQDVNSNIVDVGFIPSPLFDDGTLLGGPFTLADCSASDSLPVISKRLRRARRRDDSGSCKASTGAANTPSPDGVDDGDAGSDLPDSSLIDEVYTDPEFLLRWAASKSNEDHNSFCYMVTAGYMPWGVCSSGNAVDQSLSMKSVITVGILGEYGIWTLDHVTLGMLIESQSAISITIWLMAEG